MLGATHACANPLTAHHGTVHGIAIAVMLPHVVRWNAERVGDRYRRLLMGRTQGSASAVEATQGSELACRLEELRRAGGLPATLGEIGVPRENLPVLAADAAKQWTGTFNPRPFDAAAALDLYRQAY
jgi:alcohol dehydrogenase